MTPTEARKLIQTAYLDAVDGEWPVALDNQPFSPPNPDIITGSTQWAGLEVAFNVGYQESLGAMGNRKFRKEGLVFVRCYTPKNSATNLNDQMVEQALNVFEGVDLSGMWFYDASVRTIGADGQWFQQAVVLAFTFDHLK